MKRAITIIVLSLLCCNTSFGDNLIIMDGDTIKINGEKIRFAGIDAPESYYYGKKQVCYLDEIEVFCGKLSKEKLEEKIGINPISCVKEEGKVSYDRFLGECFVNSESLSKFMVRSGYAFDWPKYSKKKYAVDEEYAKANKLGLWIMKFEYPWEWREKIRENNK